MQENDNQNVKYSENSKLLHTPGDGQDDQRRIDCYNEDPIFSEPLTQQESSRGFHLDTKKMLIGVAIVIGIALSWVGSTQFAQSTYSPDFNAPFLVTWFSTSWMLVVFPVHFLPGLLRGKKIIQFYRESEKVFGSQGLHLKSLLKYVGPFCLLWMLTNYSYVRALGFIRAADVTALFSSCNAFVYVFSLIWLKERLGVVKVWFKRIVGDATLGQVSLFLSCLGLLSTLLLWPIIVIFHFIHYEVFTWRNIPWKYLCGNAVLGIIFNFLINFGIAFTHPLFVSLGTVLGIPINALTDFIFRGAEFGSYKTVAAFYIVIGFLFMLLPKEVEETLQEIICRRRRDRL